MKKYIIKYANGSNQYAMEAEHNSRKEATETLMNYICNHKPINGWHPSPFDFTLEEVDVKDVNETIPDFESARKALGTKPNADFYVVKRKHSEKVANLEDAARLALLGNVTRLVTDINPKYIKALIALNELFTIAEAWNKEDGFVPDFSDKKQDKWFSFFKYNNSVARFVFAGTNCSPIFATANAHIGSRLCFKTSARAAQFGKQFEDLYNKVFLW